MLQVSDVILRVRAILSDPDSDRWTDSTLVSFIHDAQQDFCTKTEILRLSSIVYLNNNQSNYTVNRMLRLIKANYGTKNLELIAHNTLDIQVPNWEEDTSVIDVLDEETGLYPTIDNVVYGRLSRGTVKVYPIPQFTPPDIFDGSTNPKIKVYYIAEALPLLELEDYIDSNVPVNAIEYYVTSKLLRADLDTQNRTFGNEQWALYLEELKFAIESIATDFIKDDSNEAHKDTTKTEYATPRGAFDEVTDS